MMGLVPLSSDHRNEVGSSNKAPTLEIVVDGARSAVGVIRLAICPPAAGFPDCGMQASDVASSPISDGRAIFSFANLPSGTYAISAFHDADGDGHLDTFLGVPKEGFGFSRNPALKLRSPHFEEAQVSVNGHTTLLIRLRYLL